MLHLHRFDHRETLARFDLFALLDGERYEAAVHRRADGGVALFRAALCRGEWINQRHERLPAADEGIDAARSLVERDLVRLLRVRPVRGANAHCHP